MLGIASYDSDEEPPAAPAAEAVPAAAEPPAKRQRTEEPAADLAPKTLARPELPTRVREQKLREIKREISLAKSATAVVQVVRQNLKDCWDARWGAEALYQVAKRSTARTRQEWAEDKAVLKLAEKLQEDAASGNDADIILLSMEALRRMTIQESQDQKSIIEHVVSLMVARSWRSPAKSLARLFWLGAPLKSEGSLKEHFESKALPSLLRSKQMDLDGPDLALILAAMKGEKGVKDTALQSKVVLRLKEKGIHRGLSATDIVEMAECLQDLGVQDQAALRPLGQEGLRRRGELTPDESHRIHTAFQAMKQPLPQVWDKPGSTKTKQTENGKVTTQAFALQEGHEKKRHGNNDIQRTSPPRVVRDMKMCSY